MAVAKEQIGELAGILKKYVPNENDRKTMIQELKGAEAYHSNQSYADTIELLIQSEEANT